MHNLLSAAREMVVWIFPLGSRTDRSLGLSGSQLVGNGVVKWGDTWRKNENFGWG
jgi:hypothetical protein